MKKVILESPYVGDVEKNLKYARLCVADSLERGESPIASHLLYTQEGILDDTIPDQRKLGIEAGLAWRDVADLSVFYVDYGFSQGMEAAFKYALEEGRAVDVRMILNEDYETKLEEGLIRAIQLRKSEIKDVNAKWLSGEVQDIDDLFIIVNTLVYFINGYKKAIRTKTSVSQNNKVVESIH